MAAQVAVNTRLSSIRFRNFERPVHIQELGRDRAVLPRKSLNSSNSTNVLQYLYCIRNHILLGLIRGNSL